MKHSAWMILGAALLSAQSAFAEIRLVNAGVVCEVLLTNKRSSPETESGVLNVIGPGRKIDVATSKVPAEQGLSFGLRIALSQDAAAQQIAVTLRHPPMGSRGVTRQRWSAPMAPGQTILSLFTFENTYEMIPGRWSFDVTSANGTRIERSFTVTDRYAVPAVQNTCFGGTPTS